MNCLEADTGEQPGVNEKVIDIRHAINLTALEGVTGSAVAARAIVLPVAVIPVFVKRQVTCCDIKPGAKNRMMGLSYKKTEAIKVIPACHPKIIVE